MYGLGVNVMLDIARPKVHLMIQIVHSIDFKGLAEKHTRSFFCTNIILIPKVLLA